MKISFLGGARTVTGSNFLVETKTKKFMVDCGLFQGKSKEVMLNTEEFQYDPTEIDFIILTHAHIDHSGRIPKLYKEGYSNPVIATEATTDLCRVMLPDSGHIQELEIEWLNRKRRREGKHTIPPIYTAQDGIDCMKLFNPVKYDEIIEIDESIKIRFNEAGHMLGSSMVEIWVYEDGKEQKLLFTGDIGQDNHPLIRDREKIESADYIIMESTYGDRNHDRTKPKGERFLDIAIETLEAGGNLIIPSFAVGRTQEILFELFKCRTNSDEEYKKKIERVLNIPVYVDSPLAISATEIFKENIDIFDEEAQAFIKDGQIPIEFPGLKFTKTAEESKALNESTEQCIIISASGMCEAGRIKHHLKHNLWKQNSTVLFVGYQAEGTLGRRILDGAKKVRIFGEEISVNARIEKIEGFSCHADQEGLLEFVSEFKDKVKQIFIVHGEYDSQKALSDLIKEKYYINTEIPQLGDVFEVTADRVHKIGEMVAKDVYRYERLELLDRLETLKEELQEMSDYIRKDLKEEQNDEKIKAINGKILELEDQILDIVKM
ncbi:MAG: MBL fold metallo-hydrolase [Clostridiales bacterium]|nr:MBL fold metallo-hydrolase [Clostridiales bacterium]